MPESKVFSSVSVMCVSLLSLIELRTTYKAAGQGSACPVKMRETGVQTHACKSAFPLYFFAFPNGKARTIVGGIPVMEFVNIQMLSCMEQQAVGFGGHVGIAEPHQPPHLDAFAGQNACHGP